MFHFFEIGGFGLDFLISLGSSKHSPRSCFEKGKYHLTDKSDLQPVDRPPSTFHAGPHIMADGLTASCNSSSWNSEFLTLTL